MFIVDISDVHDGQSTYLIQDKNKHHLTSLKTVVYLAISSMLAIHVVGKKLSLWGSFSVYIGVFIEREV